MKLWKLCGASAPLLAWAAPAAAQTAPDIDCEALPAPRVFIEAGDTQMSMIGELARRLRDADEPLTLVYLPRSTCTLADNVFHDRATTEVMRYAPSVADVANWDNVPRQCNNKTGGFPIDLGIGATFISSCSSAVTSAQPDRVKIFNGPAQAYGFVVPEGALPASGGGITWEEAYWIFSGNGITANAVPWIAEPNPSSGVPSVFIRGAATSTLLTCAANVAPEKLPASSWVGFRKDGQADRSSEVVGGLVKNANDPLLKNASIGILGVDVYETNRANLDFLAFQAPGQKFGYYPDSTPSSHDKRNVRDGHYVPWSYTQYLARVDESGDVVNENVARVLDLMDGASEARLISAAGVTPAYDLDALEVFAKKGLVPDCAMGVSREKDGGEFSLYDAPAPCGCFYESAVDPDLAATAAWQDRCISCEDDDECDTNACRHGFCEAR
jgi:hypothetical protein